MSGPRAPGARRSGGRPRPALRADPPRLAALEVLRGVREADAYANLLLPTVLRRHDLAGRDAAFTTELVSGTLRRCGTYDAVIGACVDRPLTDVDADVLDVLRLGAHQLLAMRVPTHAAVATAVDLTRSAVGRGPTGFVNAVLRRVARQPLDAWVRQVAPDPLADALGFAVVAYAHPRWVVEELAAALGDRRGELEALLRADNVAPRVTLVARPGLSTPAELVDAGGDPAPYSPVGVTLSAGDPARVSAVAEGRAGVQDEGSQLMALALATAPLEGEESRWLDLCAGPGGKAALLGALARQRGGRVLAVERQPHRAELVRRAVRRLAGSVGVVCADGTVPSWTPGSFDRVLVDAPCSGLGALRRRPEARWRRSREDLVGLVPLQRRLLSSALDAIRPGGVVAYVTCSPVLAETREVVEAVLADRPGVRLLDATAVLSDVPDAAGPLPGTLQLWPHRHGTDAMFLALLTTP
ncbi:MAG: rRNA (cytosine967-C5)-methyltransferase [Nocardioidaceae bacterium]|nr:rRNA (cytosine967-C5)-methyltransferase [Nocardioidaceae bacterium]